MNNQQITIAAVELIERDRSIVENAEILAAEAIGRLENHASVRISLEGVRSISSSYFNLILRRLCDALGEDGLRRRVFFEFDSTVQKIVYERSLQAVTKAA